MELHSHTKPPRLLFFVFAGVLILGLVYFFPTIQRDIRLMEKVKLLWLLVAIITQLATYLGSALVFSRLLKMMQLQPIISTWDLFQASIVVLFANQTLPSAGISGNTFLLRFLIRRKVAAQQALRMIVFDLLSFYTSMELMIVTILIAAFFIPRFPAYFHILSLVGLLVYALFGWLIWLLARKRTIDKIIQRIKRFRLLQKFAAPILQIFAGSSISAFDDPFPFVLQHKLPLLKITGIQLLVVLSDALTIFALFRGLSSELPVISILIGLVLTKIVALLPIAPGALVVYESSMTFFFHTLGAPLGISILVTLLYRILSFWLPIPAGFLLSRKLEQA